MSRVGNLPIAIPKGVKVEVKDNTVFVEGPKGKLSQGYRSEVSFKLEDDQIIVSRESESKQARAYHGLYRNLTNNMVIGVSQGFQKALMINGVGYRAEVQGKSLILNLGYSNPIEYVVSDDLDVTVDGPTKVIVSGIDKQKVGQVSAEIRSIRPPEPYKGKGIRYEDEQVSRKIGKSGIK